jgi:class 3 adenylate cyclase
MLRFADIRGFTPTTHASPAPLSSNYLNKAFEVIAATLRAHGGKVLIGDCESRPSIGRIARWHTTRQGAATAVQQTDCAPQ